MTPVRCQRFLGRGTRQSPCFVSRSCLHLKARAGNDPGSIGSKAQNVQHAAGLIGIGVDPAAVLCHRQKPQPVKERQRGLRIKGVQRGADEVRGKPW